jgi:O-6-methylguanine DNA methyltransferase
MTNFSKRVYDIVKTIPKGEVLTYEEVAIKLGNKNLARAVGNALNKNPNQKEIPCHRVVSKKYMLAANFRFGGLEGQKKLLEAEGHTIINNKVIYYK